MVNEERILEALKSVSDFEGKGDIVARNRVQNIAIRGGTVKIDLALPTSDRQAKFAIEDRSREAVEALEGVSEAMIVVHGAKTLEPVAPKEHSHAAHEHQHGEHSHEHHHGEHAHEHSHGEHAGPMPIPGVKNIIAVASGKGGVGKSTVCVNLALALKERGARVGLMDADIYGPSLKVMLGVEGRPKGGKHKEIAPVEQDGLKLMSLAFLTDAGAPVIWRGPIVAGLTKKFLMDVEWGELDFLLVDLPPGTGDAQLTLVQTVPITGAIIVTTPSHLALVDAEKGLRMFVEVGVPVLGIIENMSSFVCPHCGGVTHVFDRGGGAEISKKLRTPFLGEIPLDPRIREAGDTGRPVVESGAASAVSKAFLDLAESVLETCPVR
jgi:ATP-binding protein involved in chromosome partitioning